MQKLFGLLCATIFLLLFAADSSAQIAVKGQIQQEFTSIKDFALEVIDNEGATHQIPLTRKGDYHVIVYENEIYAFNFLREGIIVKSVTVDTKAHDTLIPVGTIKFDVALAANDLQLDDEVNMIALRYDEESGQIKSVGSKTSYFIADNR